MSKYYHTIKYDFLNQHLKCKEKTVTNLCFQYLFEENKLNNFFFAKNLFISRKILFTYYFIKF